MNHRNDIQKIILEQKLSTPFYLYDGRILAEQAALLAQAFSGFGLLFSVKTNPFPPLLRNVASLGIGADAASAQEVTLALEAGIPAAEIYYSCPGVTAEDVRQVFGKCRPIADSFHVLSLFEAEAARRNTILPIGLRIHPDFTMDGSAPQPSKFGIDESLLWENPHFLHEYPHLSLEGLHVHIRSQVLDADLLGQYYANVLTLALRLEETLSVRLTYLNFGGGIGIPYDKKKQSPLDLQRLRETLSQNLMPLREKLSAKLLLESGRFLACACGTYVTEIADIKKSHDKTFYILKNGANGFFKPVLRQMLLPWLNGNVGGSYEPFFTQDDDYNITVLSGSQETETVDLAGHLCSGADMMARDITVAKGNIGDLVTFSNAGSYAYSLAPLLFASQPMPQQVFIGK